MIADNKRYILVPTMYEDKCKHCVFFRTYHCYNDYTDACVGTNSIWERRYYKLALEEVAKKFGKNVKDIRIKD